MSDIDLVYCSEVLGTTNFKIIDGRTGIIMYDPNRQMRRRLKRVLEKHKNIQKPKTYYPKSVHLVKKTQDPNTVNPLGKVVTD